MIDLENYGHWDDNPDEFYDDDLPSPLEDFDRQPSWEELGKQIGLHAEPTFPIPTQKEVDDAWNNCPLGWDSPDVEDCSWYDSWTIED